MNRSFFSHSRVIAIFFTVFAIYWVAELRQCLAEEKQKPTHSELTTSDVLLSVKEHHPVLMQEIVRVDEAAAAQKRASGAYDSKLLSKNYSHLDGFYTGSTSDTQIEIPIEPAFGSLYSGYRKGSGTLPVYEDEYQTLGNGEYGIGAKISLFRDFLIDKRKLGVTLAAYDREMSELGVTKSQVVLQQAALQSYWSWVIQSHILDIYKRLLVVGEERQGQLDARVASGALAAFEALDNQRSVLQRRAKVIKQQAIVQEFAMNLSLFLRDVGGSPRIPKIEERLSKLPKSATNAVPIQLFVDEAFRSRPDLQQAKVLLDKYASQLEYDRTRTLPKVELSSFVTRDYGSGSISRDGTEVKGYLSIEIPLEQRTAKGKIAETELKMSRQKLKIRFLEEKIRNKIRIFRTQIQQSAKEYDVNVLEHIATKKLQEGETTRFTNGDSNLLFLAMRELAAAEARIHVLQSLAENLIYRSKLDAELGRVNLS